VHLHLAAIGRTQAASGYGYGRFPVPNERLDVDLTVAHDAIIAIDPRALLAMHGRAIRGSPGFDFRVLRHELESGSGTLNQDGYWYSGHRTLPPSCS
jgi:hypothetical protein